MEKIESLASGSKTTVQNCLKEHSGEPGRPKFIVSQAQVEGLRAIGMNWTEIASLLGISVRTLWDKRQLFQNFMDMEFNDMSNDELDGVVAEIIRISPSSGETMVAGALRSRGIKVQRWRMRDSMKRVDPIGKIARKLFLVRRRIYSVRSPNALWHIDSHHKLIRWRIVTHGCIDGFSRLIIYLHSCCNNKAETVKCLFEDAISGFYWPRRVRSDQGMENVEVAKLMLAKFGIDRKPVFTGRSVHNQRIERLWKDVNEYVTSHFRELFLWMEDEALLDPLNEVHLFALEWVFIRRLNQALANFVTQWNNHPIRTAQHKSPIQLWSRGIYNAPLDGTLLDSEMNVDPETYGVEEDGVAPDIRTQNDITVPEINMALENGQLQRLEEVDPFVEDGWYGIQHYMRVLEIVQ
eukprot:gene10667-11796_t